MQDLVAERAFYDKLFTANPENEHIAEGYDELHAIAFPAAPKGLVLDLGCGTGGHTIRLARKGCKVVAVDLTVPGVRAARERLARERLGALFFVADAECLPLRDRAIAVTWTSLLLHHFPNLDRLAGEVSRITSQRLIAFETNAQNAVTWLAFNVINRWWGISAMTRNQRALWPGAIERRFQKLGFRQTRLHYVDRVWTDQMGGVRRIYATATAWLPVRFRANKFLVLFEKSST